MASVGPRFVLKTEPDFAATNGSASVKTELIAADQADAISELSSRFERVQNSPYEQQQQQQPHTPSAHQQTVVRSSQLNDFPIVPKTEEQRFEPPLTLATAAVNNYQDQEATSRTYNNTNSAMLNNINGPALHQQAATVTSADERVRMQQFRVVASTSSPLVNGGSPSANQLSINNSRANGQSPAGATAMAEMAPVATSSPGIGQQAMLKTEAPRSVGTPPAGRGWPPQGSVPSNQQQQQASPQVRMARVVGAQQPTQSFIVQQQNNPNVQYVLLNSGARPQVTAYQPVQQQGAQRYMSVAPPSTVQQQQRLAGGGRASPAASSADQRPSTSAADQASVTKCAKFFRTLIHLSGQNHASHRVLELVQAVIHGTMAAATFTQELQSALRSTAQPHLLPFLQKTLPPLRQAMAAGTETIEGISPPPAEPLQPPDYMAQQRQNPQSAAQHPHVAQQLMQMQQQQPAATSQHFQRAPQPAASPAGSYASGGPTPSPMGQLASPPMHQPQPQQRPYPPTPDRQRESSSSASNSQSQSQSQSTAAADDDFNDVAAMGGVNLQEESQRILAPAGEILQADTRRLAQLPIEQTLFLDAPLLRHRLAARGLTDTADDVLRLLAAAAQHRLRDLLQQLALAALHRMEPLRINPYYEATSDVRGQLRCVDDVDRVLLKRREDRHKEALIRLSKAKGDDDSTKSAKLFAKQLARAEAEAARNRDANAAAELALASTSRKRPLDDDLPPPSFAASAQPLGAGLRTQTARPRVKRVNVRDVQSVLARDRRTRRSSLLHRSLLGFDAPSAAANNKQP